MRRRFPILLSLALAIAGAAAAGPAHQHGVARLDIAVDPRGISVLLETPLDNLLGFEHAPRTEAERRRADEAVARLHAADGLFRIDAAAGCSLGAVVLDAPALKLGGVGAAPAAADHADLDARFDFNCKDGSRAAFVDVGLFEAFKGLRRLELQVATPRGQLKATLVSPASRVALVR